MYEYTWKLLICWVSDPYFIHKLSVFTQYYSFVSLLTNRQISLSTNTQIKEVWSVSMSDIYFYLYLWVLKTKQQQQQRNKSQNVNSESPSDCPFFFWTSLCKLRESLLFVWVLWKFYG